MSEQNRTPSVISPVLRSMKRVARQTVFSIRRATTSSGRNPDFIILGAQRAGTTSLFNMLTSHPCVTPSVVKETHYFDLNYHKGLHWYRSHFPVYFWKRYSRDHRWCEASPYYLFEPRVPQRVHDSLPNVKMIVLLRNPIDRAYSDYQRQVFLGHETLSFEEAIEQERARLNGEAERMMEDPTYQSVNYRRYAYLARGHYSDQLERWLAFFTREQFLLIAAENFFRNMAAVMDDVMEFLEIPKHSFPMLRSDNRGNYDSMLPETRERLRGTFADEKSRLEPMTGIKFDWDI